MTSVQIDHRQRTSGAGATATVDDLRFDMLPAPDGYCWWYVDGISDDGVHGITLIAMIGSVFSPYYAWAGRRDPLDHVALNVAVYGGACKRWALTERRRSSLHATASTLRIGPSRLAWDGRDLVVDIDERAAPLPYPVRGQVRVRAAPLCTRCFVLDEAGRHRWWPFAAAARIEVDLDRPERRWQGAGYVDANAGDAALEADFQGWHWSRLHLGDRSRIYYDATYRSGGRRVLALDCTNDGGIEAVDVPPTAALPTTGWRVKRATRAPSAAAAKVLSTYEDTPFYARSLVDMATGDRRGLAMHESLDLDRFRSKWVRLLLPFRMPRARR